MKKRKERETGPAREGEIPMHEHRPGLGDLVGRIEARDRDGAIIQHVFCRECGKIIRVAPKQQGLYNLIRVLTYIAPLLLIFYWGDHRLDELVPEPPPLPAGVWDLLSRPVSVLPIRALCSRPGGGIHKAGQIPYGPPRKARRPGRKERTEKPPLTGGDARRHLRKEKERIKTERAALRFLSFY